MTSEASLPPTASERGLGTNKEFFLNQGKEHRNEWQEVSCHWNVTRNQPRAGVSAHTCLPPPTALLDPQTPALPLRVPPQADGCSLGLEPAEVHHASHLRSLQSCPVGQTWVQSDRLSYNMRTRKDCEVLRARGRDSPTHTLLLLSPAPPAAAPRSGCIPTLLETEPCQTTHGPLRSKVWFHIIFSGAVGDLGG